MAQDYMTLANGRQVKTDQAPPGLVGYASEKLNADKLGTASGDVFNAFRGYVGPQGGGFGGYDPTRDNAIAQKGAALGPVDWTKVDPAELLRLSQMTKKSNGSITDQLDETNQKLLDGGQLSPSEIAFLRRSQGGDALYNPVVENGPNGVQITGMKYDANTGIRLGIGQDGKAMNPNADYYDRLAAAGAASPERAAQLRQQAKDANAYNAPATKVTPVNPDTQANPFEGFKLLPGGVQNVPVPPAGSEGPIGSQPVVPVIPGGGSNFPPAGAGPTMASQAHGMAFGGMAPAASAGSAMRPSFGQRYGRSGMFGRGGVNRFRPVNGYAAGNANGVNAEAGSQGMF